MTPEEWAARLRRRRIEEATSPTPVPSGPGVSPGTVAAPAVRPQLPIKSPWSNPLLSPVPGEIGESSRQALQNVVGQPKTPEEAYLAELQARGGVVNPRSQSAAVGAQMSAKENLRSQLQPAISTATDFAAGMLPIQSQDVMAANLAAAAVGGPIANAIGRKLVRPIVSAGPTVGEAASYVADKAKSLVGRSEAQVAERAAQQEASVAANAARHAAEEMAGAPRENALTPKQKVQLAESQAIHQKAMADRLSAEQNANALKARFERIEQNRIKSGRDDIASFDSSREAYQTWRKALAEAQRISDEEMNRPLPKWMNPVPQGIRLGAPEAPPPPPFVGFRGAPSPKEELTSIAREDRTAPAAPFVPRPPAPPEAPVSPPKPPVESSPPLPNDAAPPGPNLANEANARALPATPKAKLAAAAPIQGSVGAGESIPKGFKAAAVRDVEGNIHYGQGLHNQVAEQLGVPLERVRDTGWVVDGKYYKGDIIGKPEPGPGTQKRILAKAAQAAKEYPTDMAVPPGASPKTHSPYSAFEQLRQERQASPLAEPVSDISAPKPRQSFSPEQMAEAGRINLNPEGEAARQAYRDSVKEFRGFAKKWGEKFGKDEESKLRAEMPYHDFGAMPQGKNQWKAAAKENERFQQARELLGEPQSDVGQAGRIKLGAPLREPVAGWVRDLKETIAKFGANLKSDAKIAKDFYVGGLTDARGLPEHFRGSRNAMIGARLAGRDYILRMAMGLEESKGLKRLFKNRITADDEAQIAKFRWNEDRTPKQEQAIKEMLDSWDGGRAATIKRLEEVKAREPEIAKLEKREVDTRRIEEIDQAIIRLRDGDPAVPLKTDKRSEQLADVVIPTIRNDFERIKRAVDIGVISEEAAIKRAGIYQAKLYKWNEVEQAARAMGLNISGIKGKHLKARLRDDQVSDEMLKALVKNKPAWTYGLPAYSLEGDIEHAIWFKELAENASTASKTPKPGWEQMPAGKKFGMLSEKWVPKEVKTELTRMFEPYQDNWAKFALREIFDPIQQGWSAAKTVLSIATQMRNVLSGTAMYALAAGDTTSFAKLARAFKEVRIGGKKWEEAIRAGMDMKSVASGEMKDWFDDISPNAPPQFILRRMVKAAMNMPIHKQAAKLYAGTDAVFKMGIYMHATEDLGLSPREAVKYTGLYYPDYRDVSQFWEQIGRRAWPMMTFYYKTAQQIPRLSTFGVVGGTGKRLLGREGSALSIGAPGGPMFHGKVRTDIKASAIFLSFVTGYLLLRDMQESKSGLTPEQINKARELDPQYIKEGLTLMMPFKAKNGEVRHADLTYATPWPALQTMANAGGYRTVREFIQNFVPTNPVMSWMYTATTGYDTFTKKRLWSEEVGREADAGNQAAKEEINRAMKEWWIRTIMPNIYPGGKGFNKVEAAIKGEEFGGQTQGVGEALLENVGGIPIRHVDLGKAALKRKHDLDRTIDEQLFKNESIRQSVESGKTKLTTELRRRMIRNAAIAYEADAKLRELGLDDKGSLEIRQMKARKALLRSGIKGSMTAEDVVGSMQPQAAAGGQ